MLEGVGKRLADGEVRRALQRGGEPALADPGTEEDLDRDRELGGSAFDRGRKALVGERGLVDPGDELAQVPQRLRCAIVQGGQGLVELVEVGAAELVACQGDAGQQGGEVLLGAVVQVAFEPAPRLLLGGTSRWREASSSAAGG